MFETSQGRPPAGPRLEKLRRFLATVNLTWDERIEYTVILFDGDGIAATGSRRHNVLQCIGVDPARQGEGLSATVVTELVKNGLAAGHNHLFIFTKPASAAMFSEFGFYLVAGTDDAVLLENRRDGVKRFVENLEQPPAKGVVAAIVANCNPFTNGHLYLVETAAKACGLVHLFILSEDRSRFSSETRMELVKAGTAHLPNVVAHPTSDYLISSATFPDYFIKDKAEAEKINCSLDLAVFGKCFAGPLGITRRYVGTEPNDPVTLAYNRQMREQLPRYGVEVVEVPRLETGGKAVSASRVRALLDEGKLGDIRGLVPDGTFRHLRELVK